MSKIALTPNVSGSGVFTLASPNSNTDRTLTLPDEAGTVLTSAGVPASAMPAGSVLQVVQGAYTTFSSTSSTSFVDTGVEATITPTSVSSKILVLANLNGIYKSGSSIYSNTALYRNGTWINYLDAIVGYTASTSGGGGVVAASFLDNPASASALTYKIRIQVSGSGTINWNNNSGTNLSTSSLTLLEIAG